MLKKKIVEWAITHPKEKRIIALLLTPIYSILYGIQGFISSFVAAWIDTLELFR